MGDILSPIKGHTYCVAYISGLYILGGIYIDYVYILNIQLLENLNFLNKLNMNSMSQTIKTLRYG